MIGPEEKRRMRLTAFLLVGMLVAAAFGCSSGSATPTPVGVVMSSPVANPTATPQAIVTSFEGQVREFEINLASNGSLQQGTAVFTRRNDIAHVEIILRPGAGVQQATLRRGTCLNPEGFEDTLELIVGGILRQELRDIPFDELLEGNWTLVVNPDVRSYNEIAACGDLPKAE